MTLAPARSHIRDQALTAQADGITTQIIISQVPGSLRPGEIVLMHCGPGGMKAGDHSTMDADALPAVIQRVHSRGYSSVTVDALSGLGYHVLATGGAVTGFGMPGYGSLAGRVAAGLAVTAIAGA